MEIRIRTGNNILSRYNDVHDDHDKDEDEVETKPIFINIPLFIRLSFKHTKTHIDFALYK